MSLTGKRGSGASGSPWRNWPLGLARRRLTAESSADAVAATELDKTWSDTALS